MGRDKMPPLSPEETYVIKQQGTEAPFSGRFWQHGEDGSYICRQCGAQLFTSEQKFDSGCGWPSFDQAIPKAVEERPDKDGRRTEIVCADCGGHLGHVFRGEKLTAQNTRFCVNSLSLAFEPEEKLQPLPGAGETPALGQQGQPDKSPEAAPASEAETAVFAGGCFWGLEAFFRKVPGVISAVSGYTGGTLPEPSYKQVCTGQSGHAEAVKVIFDPKIISYEDLTRIFFEIHDPSQLNRQGPDFGTQYRSAIFPQSEKQRITAQKLINILKNSGLKVVTTLEEASVFYPAEDYHQDYLNKTGRPHCQIRVSRF